AGASHPFYWKPKLRIPDIYENDANKRAFGAFLERCLNAGNEEKLLREIVLLDGLHIKGLGPAVANILYFLHPTLLPPFNTAIVNGFNSLFGEKRKLGSWSEYLAMRAVMLEVNQQHKTLLSSDLGAIAGLLFDIGSNKLLVGNEHALTDAEREKIEKSLRKRRKEVEEDDEQGNLHSEMQAHLLKIGSALGYDVICASNDRTRCHAGTTLGSMSMSAFPALNVDEAIAKTIRLIDVLWFEKDSHRVAAAFEVEKSTTITSGMGRMIDLHHSFPDSASSLFIVIPDKREKELQLLMQRPSVRATRVGVDMHYLLFSDIRKHCDAICMFGESKDVLQKIARKTGDINDKI
ncbi:MAG: hypothetical protein Q9M23_00215, partial [Mariprofundaceae bacterium]|nr:hypothetical protein [Mariprofundaceae bacterium]